MKNMKTTASAVHDPNQRFQFLPWPSPLLKTPGPAVIAGFIFCLLFSAFGAGAQTPAISAEIFVDHFSYLGHSPEICFRKAEEGIAADGTNYYLIYRRSI